MLDSMTNEEAVTIIKQELSKYIDTLSVYAKKRKKAFDMAIEALEQPQPCEECKFQGDKSFCDVCCHNYMSMFADKMQEVGE